MSTCDPARNQLFDLSNKLIQDKSHPLSLRSVGGRRVNLGQWRVEGPKKISNKRRIKYKSVHCAVSSATQNHLNNGLNIVYYTILETKLKQMTLIAAYCLLLHYQIIKTEANDFNCRLTNHKAHKEISTLI